MAVGLAAATATIENFMILFKKMCVCDLVFPTLFNIGTVICDVPANFGNLSDQ